MADHLPVANNRRAFWKRGQRHLMRLGNHLAQRDAFGQLRSWRQAIGTYGDSDVIERIDANGERWVGQPKRISLDRRH